MLRIENLQKHYGSHPVFCGLTLDLGPGCHALCDEESTGKSTLLSIIAGILPPDGGDVFIKGHSITRQHDQVTALRAWVPDDCLCEPRKTGRELLEQVAAEKNATIDNRVLDLARRLKLEPHLDKRFEQMSTGTRRKAYLTAAALGNPAVIIADGPDNGLDAHARGVLAEQFRIWGQDRVVLFSSYDPELVEACGASRLTLQDRLEVMTDAAPPVGRSTQ